MKSASPLPGVEITVDGSPLNRSQLASLASVRVARVLSLPAQCEVAFAADGLLGVAASDLAQRAAIGGRLEVQVEGEPRPLFTGDITAHERDHAPDGSAELRVRAYDELHRLRKRQRVMVRDGVTLGQVASELAGDAGVSCEVDHVASRWPVLVQHAGSDLDLVTTIASDAGVYLVVDEGVLRSTDLGGFGPSVELELRRQLLSARFETTADPACRTVSATGWDPVTAMALDGRATTDRTARGATALAEPSAVGADGARFIAGRHGPTGDHLEAIAQGELDRRIARETTLVGVASGDAELVPGRRVRVTGVDQPAAGDYVLTRTTHTIDGAGYLVELSTSPPDQSERARGSEVTMGVVESADDPESRGRVRVTLPAYGGIELDWRPVMSPGAGPGKGLVALPDRGDRVLLLMPGGDPAAAVVVGGLHGGDGPADTGVVDGSVRRWSFATPGGQRVILDDERSQLVLANSDGSSVVLAPDQVTLHASTDMVIEAPGHTITLRADRVDLRRARSAGGGPDLPPPHPGGGR
ncbi:MAG: phage baseplate assembly protein V [Acidimicrobiales bacterium]